MRFIALTYIALLANATELTIDDICQFDKYCDRAIDYRRKPVEPSPELIAILKKLSPEITRASEKYGVSREAIVGAIMAENTMNVTKSKSSVKEFLVNNNLAGVAKTMNGGVGMSLGLGAIKPETAMEVENDVAKKEGRPQRDLGQVYRIILEDPKESVIYAAAILRKAQDQYKVQGFDIKDNVPVLATVYNLGRLNKQGEDRAEVAKREGRDPKINYFGFFVRENLNKIKEIAAVDDEKRASQLPKDEKYIRAFQERVPLAANPPNCISTDGNYGLVAKYERTMTRQQPTIVSSALGGTTVLGQGLDCEMKTWNLIHTDEGETGWVSEDDMKKRIVQKKASNTCVAKPNPKCVAGLKEAVGENNVLTTNGNGLLEIRLASKDNDKDFDVAKWDPKCLSSQDKMGYGFGPHTQIRSGIVAGRPNNPNGAKPPGMGMPSSYNPNGYNCGPGQACGTGSIQMNPVDGEAIREMQGQVDRKKQEVMSAFGVSRESQLPSDVQYMFSQFEPVFSADCKVTTCMVDTGRFAGMMNLDAKRLTKSLSATVDATRRFMGVAGVASKPVQQGTLKQILDEIESKCITLLNDDKDLRYYVDNARKELDGTPQQYVSSLLYAMPELLLKKCEFIENNINGPKALVADGIDEGRYCEECSRAKLNMPNVGTTVFASMLNDPKDQKQFMRQDLREVTDFISMTAQQQRQRYAVGGGRNSSIDDGACKYDPMATFERVQKVLKLDCVKKVLIPDQFIVKSIAQAGELRAIQGPTLSGDRFSIQMQGGCVDGEAE